MSGRARVAVGKPQEVAPETVVHRVGGGDVPNLSLSAMDRTQMPPGVSVLLGGTPQDAAQQMRAAFPRSKKWAAIAHTVGSTTAAAVRGAGFEIVPDPTSRFPNHARLIHPGGEAGFTNEHLERLALVFQNTTGC
jgi:hypothetical protein